MDKSSTIGVGVEHDQNGIKPVTYEVLNAARNLPGLGSAYYFSNDGEANLESMKYACQRGLILLSTPPREGRNHCFGRLATETNKLMAHLSLHWSLHPLRGEEWYEHAIDGMTPEQVARELEIS